MNISSAALLYLGGAFGAALSYLSFLCLLIYYFFAEKGGINIWMVLIGLLYFALSGLNYVGPTAYFLIIAIKYFIIILGGYEVVKKTTNRELLLVLLLGACTILLHAAVLGGGSAEYGRFSGFYINPNAGGFICISGYALTYSIKNKRLRLISQIVFTIMGLLTLSRTFIALWMMINAISLKIDIKNVRIFLYGFGLLSLLFVFSELLPVKNPRIEQLKALSSSSSDEEVSVDEINSDSRSDTWSTYFDDITNRPFIGNGFNSFTVKNFQKNKVGIHNTFLLVLGEAGVIPFLIIATLYVYMLIQSFRLFKYEPNLLLQSIGLFFFLMASHVYFTHAFILFISMWIQAQIEKHKYLLQ